MQKSRQSSMLIGLSMLLIMMFTLFINQLHASDNLQNNSELVQKNKLKGIVRSKKNNEPIPGVNVTIKGSFVGTITNAEGEFNIEIVGQSATLVFSFVGMKKQEVKANVGEALSVLMEEDAIGLDEVVAVGYGTMKKSDLSGSVESVTAESFKNQPVTTISQALQGRLSGVVVSSNSGSPGSEAKIRIRGINSMKGDNNPLYVVDGVPLNVGIGNINVKDIQSIEVLKDASATAIYGSRGANGVILITTKRGLKNGESQLELNINTGISSLPQKYDLLDITDFANLVNEYRPDYYSEEQLNEFSTMSGVDWQDEIYKLGLTQDYQLNLSGGNKDMQYYLSGNYVDQTGILLNSKEAKYSVRSNVSVHVLDNLNVDMNLYFGKKNGLNNMGNGGKNSPTWNALIYSPTFPIYDENGDWNMQDKLASPNARNPIMMLEEQYEDYYSNTTTFNAKATYKFLTDFTLDVVYGTDFNSYQRGSEQNEYITSGKTSASLSERKSFTWTNQNILTYNKNINDVHRITATAVNEQSSFENSGFNAYGSEVSPISVGYDNLGIAKSQSIGSWRNKVTMQSYIGRIAYSLKDRYLLTATYRADGTSKFQGANKWGYFPSAALAWRLSEESFLKNNDFISNLKLRASWGQTGNQGIDAYATVSRIAGISTNFGTTALFPGSSISGADNPYLKWETTTQTNIGLDLSILNGKLDITLDYFDKLTTDLLHSVQIPAYAGGGTANRNIGEMSNKGIEAVIQATPLVTNDFRWDLSFNISSYKNKLLSLGLDSIIGGSSAAGSLTDGSPFIIQVGEPLGAFYGYEWEGIYTSKEADQAAIYKFMPGDNKYLDFNGDSIINGDDKHIIGYAAPKFIWALNNDLSFKNFELNIFIQGVHGRKVLNSTYASAATLLPDATSITHVDGKDFWTVNNEDATFANPFSSTTKKFLNSTQFLENASYIKVRNIALAYNIDKQVLKYFGLKLTLSAQNALTLTNYKGYDPEVSTTGGDLDGAMDIGAYPIARTISFGLTATF